MPRCQRAPPWLLVLHHGEGRRGHAHGQGHGAVHAVRLAPARARAEAYEPTRIGRRQPATTSTLYDLGIPLAS
jgi:hypothetical protein